MRNSLTWLLVHVLVWLQSDCATSPRPAFILSSRLPNGEERSQSATMKRQHGDYQCHCRNGSSHVPRNSKLPCTCFFDARSVPHIVLVVVVHQHQTLHGPPSLRWDVGHQPDRHWPENSMSTSSANLPGGRPALASASYFPQAEEIMLPPRRQPACVRCQQRKVKCDHKDPCATCVKVGVPCVASSQVKRRRKRRLPERDLLDRIRKYEHLLTQHNIKFEPLHPSVSVPKGSPDSHVEGPCESDDEPGTTTASSHAGTSSPRRRVREAKYTPPRALTSGQTKPCACHWSIH